LTTKGCGSFVNFVDAVSLLHLIHGSTYSTAETVSLEGKLKAAGHKNPRRGSDGTLVRSGASRNVRKGISFRHHEGRPVAPEPTSYKVWDSGFGTRGAKFSLAKNLRKCNRIRANISDNLSGEAREVARQMLDDSVKFLNELSTWISNHYNEVQTRSGTSDKECWGLISHCVRTIFSVLGLARSLGHGPYPEGSKASSIL
jgi:hypothetical protein